ncbi:Ig-like domain-containing protein [Neobacillus sp. NPDC093127]|uniref:Ig-like domain-containing protein n=1 Tax=Neobacillus sp. NPDC093127 TaxID=3364296 RepID=UPI00380C6BF9
MKLKKVYSFLLLSLVILLTGGYAVHAETPYDSEKANFEKVKAQSVQGKKIEGFENLKISKLLKAKITPQKGYSTKALDGNTFYETEPNNYAYQANILNRGDIVLGTFTQFDVDVFQISITKPSNIAIAGIMDPYSRSDIGFVLKDANENLLYPYEMILDDHQQTCGFNLTPGVYYIYALNVGERVTNDLYALAWDYLEQPTPGDTTQTYAPTIDPVNTDDLIITGKSEPGFTVEMSYKGTGGVAATDSKGKYMFKLRERIPLGTSISVTAVDAAGNRRGTSYTTVVQAPVKYKNGWILENNKWYFYVNGNEKKTGWLQQGNTWYFLNYQTGAMATGWIYDGGKWYSLQPSGAMKTGWLQDGSKWYYLASNGAMKTGWLQDKGSWYYLASNGAMKTGWLQDKGSWYYLANNGAMQTGWVLSNGKWYYLYSSGKMAYSTKIGTYKLGRDGAWIR